jgi:hypothetical protein
VRIWVDEAGSGLCQKVEFGIRVVAHLGSVSRELMRRCAYFESFKWSDDGPLHAICPLCRNIRNWCHPLYTIYCNKTWIERRDRCVVVFPMGLRETGFGNVNWINLALDRDPLQAFINTIMNLVAA